jgi:hypothetical protein
MLSNSAAIVLARTMVFLLYLNHTRRIVTAT